MIGPVIIASAQNVAFLIAMVFLYDRFLGARGDAHSLWERLVGGLVLGGIGVAIMATRFEFQPGVIFDARSVLLGVSGLFFGFVPTAVAMLMTAAFRAWQGGAGAPTGVIVIFCSGAIGLLWRHFRKGSLAGIGWRELIALGFAVHAAMFVAFAIFLNPVASGVLKVIAPAILVVYPLGTAALGALVADRLRFRENISELRESRQRYQSLFENNHAVMLLIDPRDGAIVEANPAAANYYGWSRERLCEMKIAQINTSPEEAVREEIARASEQRRNHFHFRHRLADGRIRHVEVFSGPILVAGRTLLYSIVHDITKQTEQAEAIVAAKVAAEQANRAKADFLSMMSHELRTPLNQIISPCECVAEEISDPEHRELLTIAAQASRDLLKMIERILAFGESQPETLRLREEAIDARPWLESAIQPFLPTAAHRRKTIRASVHPDVPEILHVDAGLLASILGELLNNAIAFSEPGEILTDLDRRNGQIRVTVADPGPVIPAEDRARCFEPFFQGDMSIRRKQGGVGMGLPIARQMAIRLGGRLGIEPTADGCGNAFVLTFPLSRPKGAGDETTPVEAPPAPQPPESNR